MINIENTKIVLRERIKTSVKLKSELDSAKTNAKKKYLLKKLSKNNEVVHKLLDALQRAQAKTESES